MFSTVIRTCTVTIVSLYFLVNAAHAQKTIRNYEAEWKKVTGFVEKGLPKSALTEVKKIYTLARADKQDAQIVKSLVFVVRLQNENREDNEVFSISEIEKEIATTKEPVTSILKNLLAQMYYWYYQQHRWQLYNRTQTVDFNKTDIATWGVKDFHKKIGELYLQSLKEEKLLQQTNLEPFDAIIIKGNVRHLRPTLYDLLAHRALSYFENDERDIKKPAYAFEIDQAAAFAPAKEFVTRSFITRDTLSLQHKALQTYQKLIVFHLRDPKPDALIDVDLKRLEFVHNKSTHAEKDRLYVDALTHITNQYDNLPAAAQAWYLLAAWYEQKANEYKPYGDTTQRFARLKAKEILEKIASQKDSSEGKYNAQNLLYVVKRPSFHFSVEKVNVPGEPFRVFVKYRNVNKLYLRIIKVNDALKKLLETPHDDKYWPAVISAAPVKSWEQFLPATNDLQQHGVEIKADALPAGEYIMLASSQSNLNAKDAFLAARVFYVSTISYVNNKNDFFVLNRDNGQPLSNASVHVWEQVYDYRESKYEKRKTNSYTTDQNGFFRIQREKIPANDYRSYTYLLEITHNNDKLFMNDYLYEYNERDPEKPNTKLTNAVYLFTDRSIYRPGQTIFFKGIVLSLDPTDKKNTIAANYKTSVILRDANYQDIDTLTLTTNEFGSFNGKFQLPQTGLSGQFGLYTKTDGGNVGFRVEEYKRPKFYVDYEPIKGTYKVNDQIKVTGVAKAYAGNNIDGATVKYRVVRQARFLYPWRFWGSWFPRSEGMEIAHGEVKTDKDGKFIISFTAIPDLKIDKKMDPVFDYTVYADVTDINGETRSGEKFISVSYKSLMLVTSIPATLAVDSFKTVYVRTQNMNGEFEPANVRITISKLKEEKRLIRERFWERPDQFVMTKEEYIRHFPHDEYDNEKDPRSWEKGELVLEKTDSARKDGKPLSITGPGAYTAGVFVIEIETKDKNGETVKDIQYIELFDEKSNKPGRTNYLWSAVKDVNVEPGEIAKIELGTSAEGIFLIQQMDRGKKEQAAYSFLSISNEKKQFNFDATEADRGGYGVAWAFVKHNRFYNLNQVIYVPWSNKELAIAYATFRDKTLPGSTEQWKLKISGYKNEKVASEMLAAMYDASLDQFLPHGWSQPSVWPVYYRQSNWTATHNFIDVQSVTRNFSDREPKDVYKQYDYFFFDEGNEPFTEMRRMKTAGAPTGNAPTTDAMATDQVQSPPPAEESQEVGKQDGVIGKVPGKSPETGDIQIRKNLNETAFFFPELRTDADGNIEFSFTIPEALTKWKFLAIAHTKEAAFGTSTKEIITQKELMVQPNTPRFLREGDKIELSAKVVNMTDKEFTGTAHLELFDAETNKPIDGLFHSSIPNQYFTVAAGQSESVNFPIEIPHQFNKALVWRIVAKSGSHSDGEENFLPVLTNRMLVTETITLPMRNTNTKNFTFNKLGDAQNSSSLTHHALIVEYTSNPAWYAVQALPYLVEFPYESSEQMWNRYYANSLASHIANSSPRIRQVFEKWKITDTSALMSNLQKNQELKSVLLEETPWVLEAKNEAQQKRNIALLFDIINMSDQLNSSYQKLKQMQSSNGGFVWFQGGPDDRYMTQYIVTGIGHLENLKAVAKGAESKLTSILQTAIPYLDRKIKEDYDNLIKYKADLKKQHIGYIQVQYLYMRSFFPNTPLNKEVKTAYDYYFNQARQFWVPQSKYMQGMIALALHRKNDVKTSAAILKSLKETAITNEELGMYWKDQRRGWFWYEAPIETQALLIETFQEAGNDMQTVDDLKTWLLKNKQTNNWNTTKATAEACYALLLQGTNWLTNEPVVEIKLGNTTVRSTDNSTEAGTGYFKRTIEGASVKPGMANITVTVGAPVNPPLGAKQPATWGAVYWQYFEDLDKITTAATPLSLVKKLFKETNTDRGPVLSPINNGSNLKVGDKIKVRVELRVDRDMEYVHMKDMRAAGFEPINILSGYRYQGGLGYYESTRDASTNFFFNYLRKGTYVFEYSLFVNHSGNFSNGITTIQSMYAPEFTSHSEGIRVNVDQ